MAAPYGCMLGNFVEAAIDFALNYIWTIVQITCVTYRARPAGSLLQVTVTFQEHLHLKSVVTHPCSLRLENLP